VLLPAAVVLALVGLVLGVAEFLVVSAAAIALVASGWASLVWQLRRGRGSLWLEWSRPAGELYVGGQAVVELQAGTVPGRWAPALEVHGVGAWQRSHPGLSAAGVLPDSAAFGRRRGGRGGARRRGAGVGRRPSSSAPGAVRVPALRPGDRWSLALAVPTTARGLWSVGPLELWCTDAFGLVRRRLQGTPRCDVVVLPDPGAARRCDQEERRQARPRFDGADVQGDGGAQGGDEFEGLRPYQPGDRLTRLHWPAVARGQLLSRHFVEGDERRLRLEVDTRPWKIEDSVSWAAAAGTAALAAARPVELYTAQGERVVAVPGPWGRTVLLRALALVPPAPVPGASSLRGRSGAAGVGP
jgi:uncharacterized protein (DUF58 family)